MALAESKQKSATTHGLSNKAGENNCFINSVIQILWHLDIFREHFGEIQEHMCFELECVFCTLKELFVNFQYSEAVTLPPNFIRKAMAKCYKETGRFQLSKMDYAVECYEAVLQQIHSQITGSDWDTTCTDSKCLTHKIFSYSSCQIDVCLCGATSEPFPSEDILFYVSADSLLKSMKKSKKSQKEILKDGNVFGKILRDSLSTDKQHKCPDSQQSSCKKSAKIETMLLRSPYTISLSLSWASETSSKESVVEVLKSVGHIINISQMFSISLDETADQKVYHLSGIVNYYGHHFSAFVFNSNLSRWVFCDDASFRTVGEAWDEVVQLIKRARYQPELLIYSIRDLDVWLEESKRNPPKIPPKPNLADLISAISPSTSPDLQVIPRSSKNMDNSNDPILPPNLNSVHPTAPPISDTTSLQPSRKYSSPQLTQYSSPQPSSRYSTSSSIVSSNLIQGGSPIPSAPPAHLVKNNPFYISHHVKTHPQPPAQSLKPKRSNPLPSSRDPVVLTKYALKPERQIVYPPRSLSNHSTTPASTPDLMDFETITHPTKSDTASAPNLLLDVPAQTPSQTGGSFSKPVSKQKKKEEAEDLIDFTVIPHIKSDTVYNEFFPDSATDARGSSKRSQLSNDSK